MEELFNIFGEEEIGFFEFNQAKCIGLVEQGFELTEGHETLREFEEFLEKEEARAQEEALKKEAK